MRNTNTLNTLAVIAAMPRLGAVAGTKTTSRNIDPGSPTGVIRPQPRVGALELDTTGERSIVSYRTQPTT